MLRTPASVVLYALWHLLPLEREEAEAARVVREAEELRLVGRLAYAFHEPAKLQGEHRAFMDRVGEQLGLVPSAEQARAEGAELLALARAQGWIIGADATHPTEG